MYIDEYVYVYVHIYMYIYVNIYMNVFVDVWQSAVRVAACSGACVPIGEYGSTVRCCAVWSSFIRQLRTLESQLYILARHRYAAVCCNMLKCLAMCCNALLCVAVYCSDSSIWYVTYICSDITHRHKWRVHHTIYIYK